MTERDLQLPPLSAAEPAEPTQKIDMGDELSYLAL